MQCVVFRSQPRKEKTVLFYLISEDLFVELQVNKNEEVKLLFWVAGNNPPFLMKLMLKARQMTTVGEIVNNN